MDDDTIALVTGGNKGIGLEVATRLAADGARVVLGCRSRERGEEAAGRLTAQGFSVSCVQLDVTDSSSVSRAAAEIDERFGLLDVLINNAGISGGRAGKPSEVTLERLRSVYDTNVFGVVTVTNAMLPLLRRSAAGRIVNVSSSVGSLSNMSDPGYEHAAVNNLAYQSSKAALNAITIAYAKELAEAGIKVNAADPGFTATDFNQHRGSGTVQQAATAVIRLARVPDDGPTATFQDENDIVPW
jgi:NAD(P)-dependent dehydrogenase (short-subunit alcohol dehydrogenase family)